MGEPRRKSEGLALSAWLDRIAQIAGYETGNALIEETGADCWVDFFDDDYSPGEAWAEECSND